MDLPAGRGTPDERGAVDVEFAVFPEQIDDPRLDEGEQARRPFRWRPGGEREADPGEPAVDIAQLRGGVDRTGPDDPGELAAQQRHGAVYRGARAAQRLGDRGAFGRDPPADPLLPRFNGVGPVPVGP